MSVPYYSTLSIKKISEFVAATDQDMHLYIPDNQEFKKVSREWICNICATVMGTVFTDWLKEQIRDRNEEVKDKKDLNIELDADVAAAFRSSTAVSCKFSSLDVVSFYLCYSAEGPGGEHAQDWREEKTHNGLDQGRQRERCLAGDAAARCNGRVG